MTFLPAIFSAKIVIILFSLSKYTYTYTYIHNQLKETTYIFCAAADIVFDYRQKVTRSFEYLQGDYYIAPLFLVTLLHTHSFHFISLFYTTFIWLDSLNFFFFWFHRTKLVSSLKMAHCEQHVISHFDAVREFGKI